MIHTNTYIKLYFVLKVVKNTEHMNKAGHFTQVLNKLAVAKKTVTAVALNRFYTVLKETFMFGIYH